MSSDFISDMTDHEVEQNRERAMRIIIVGSAVLLCAVVASTAAVIRSATANEPEKYTYAIGITVIEETDGETVDQWTFEGEDGLPVIIHVTAESDARLIVTLEGPYGFELAYAEGVGEVTFDAVLEAYNVHTVTVGVDRATTYSLTIERADPQGSE